MKKVLKIIIPVLTVFFFVGCVKEQNKYLKQRMGAIELGMSKNDVVKILGNDGYVRASTLDQSNNVVEVLQYEYTFQEYDPLVGPSKYPDVHDTFWFKFCDEKLVQWGRPYEVEIPSDRLKQNRPNFISEIRVK